MILLRTIAAELRKAATLPGSLGALAVTLPAPLGITVLNAVSVHNAVRSGHPEQVGYTTAAEAAFSAVPLGTVGAIVLGVIVISSEYTGRGRQITATLTATPDRLTVLAAKAAVLVLLTIAAAAVAIPTCLVVAHLIVGGPVAPDTAARAAGAALYWTLTGLMAMAMTVLTRSGIIPLIVLIVNSSLVSVSVLLSHVTSLAYYLPDMAGSRLFATDALGMFEGALAPLPGGLVMAAWTLALLTIAYTVFTRRGA